MRVLIAGVSTRAAAESAARAGFAVTAIDAFGDLDQAPSVRGLSLPRAAGMPFSARGAAQWARRINCDAVAYLSNFENHPGAVRTLAADRALWGNTPEVLRRVRNPVLVADVLRRTGLATLAVHTNNPKGPNGSTLANDPNDPNDWLLKPLRSGGGHGIRPWRRERLARGSYLQQFVQGTSGSVVFSAAGGRVVPLGMSRQLIGEEALGAGRFRYCGNILASVDDPQFEHGEALMAASCALARVVGREFSLVGVNGIDFVALDGVPYATEVNPRWSASMELVERAFGISMFGIHAASCSAGHLPAFAVASQQHGFGALGKAVVFARQDVTVPDTRAWLADASVRDVPHPGERVSAGHPICTIFADGRNAAECHAALVRRAETVYRELAPRRVGTKHKALSTDQGPSTDRAPSTRQQAPAS